MKRINLKKSLVTLMMLAAFVVVGSRSYAQSTDQEVHKQHTMKTPEQRATMKADKISKQLTLSSDQYSKIYNSILSAEHQIKSLRAGTTDKNSIKDQIKKINVSTNESIKGVLTADQQKQYKQFKEDRKEKRKDKLKDKKDKKDGHIKIKKNKRGSTKETK